MRISHLFLYLNLCLGATYMYCAPAIAVITVYPTSRHDEEPPDLDSKPIIMDIPSQNTTPVAIAVPPTVSTDIKVKTVQPKTIHKATADFKSVTNLRQHLPLNIPEANDLNDHDRREIECIAWNLYFEVRGGKMDEQIAIAFVPINRIGLPDFGDDICTNVFQYTIRNGVVKHQFSWVGRILGPKWKREDDSWEKMQKIALSVYQRRIRDVGQGATYFQSVRLSSSWAHHARKFRLGGTLFWS